MATSSVLTDIYKGDDTVPIVEKIIGLSEGKYTSDTSTSLTGEQRVFFNPVLNAGTMQLLATNGFFVVESADIVTESALTVTDPSDVVENVVFFDNVLAQVTLRGIQYDTTSNTGTATISWLWDGTPFSVIVNVT